MTKAKNKISTKAKTDLLHKEGLVLEATSRNTLTQNGCCMPIETTLKLSGATALLLSQAVARIGLEACEK